MNPIYRLTLDEEQMNQLPMDILRQIYSFGSVETKKLKKKAENEIISAFIRQIMVSGSLTRPELETSFHAILKCPCCDKHQQNRPIAAHIELILPYPTKIKWERPCTCDCRHKLRRIPQYYANAW